MNSQKAESLDEVRLSVKTPFDKANKRNDQFKDAKIKVVYFKFHFIITHEKHKLLKL
jgi:hypothetical protein